MVIPGASMRIGLVTPAWPGTNTANGIATAVAHLATGLTACGHEVTIVPFAVDAPHDFPRIVELPERKWRLLDRIRMRFGLDPDAVLHAHIARRIADAAREAIHRHGIEILVMEETQGWAGFVARAIDIPVVVTLHGPWWLHRSLQTTDNNHNTEREKREAEGVLHVAAITAPSRDVLERTKGRWKFPDLPTKVLRNPMPVAPVSSELDFQKLLFVGRFELLKGGDVVLEAFYRLGRKHPSCRLTFVGPDIGIPGNNGTLLTLQDALSLLPAEIQERIEVKGQCSREQVALLRKTHGLAVVASRYENFSGTMVEAMAAGSALICTRVGGGGEFPSDKKTALLVPPGDPQALADACLELLEKPHLAKRLGIAARAQVASQLAPEEIGRQMAAFLRPLCQNADGGRRPTRISAP